MSESNDDSIFGRLFRRMSGGSSEGGDMNEYEKRALAMQKDLKPELHKHFRQYENSSQIQWAVRTSMNEIGNMGALDQTLGELDDNSLSEFARRTGMSKEEARNHFKNKGDQLDKDSVQRAYVIVEFNMGHKNISYSHRVATEFLEILNDSLRKHRPEREEVRSDEVTPVSYGAPPRGDFALFDTKYFFE